MAKDWARHLPSELHRRGLRDDRTDCEVALYEGGSMQSEFWRLSLAQARDLVVAEGFSPQRIYEWEMLLAQPGPLVPGRGHRRGLRTRLLGRRAASRVSSPSGGYPCA